MSTLQEGLARYLSPQQRTQLAGVTVGIAGAGGLGSNCAMLLLRSGIRHFVIADYDVLDASNLNRQYYSAAQVGMVKVEALVENLRAIDADVTLHTYCERLTATNLPVLFAPCDIIIEALDDAQMKRTLVETLSDRPLVCASGMAGWGGPPMHSRTIGSTVTVVGDFTSDIAKAPPMAPRVMMAAAMQADAVLSYILGPSALNEEAGRM